VAVHLLPGRTPFLFAPEKWTHSSCVCHRLTIENQLTWK
jgi:hypothetical protein